MPLDLGKQVLDEWEAKRREALRADPTKARSAPQSDAIFDATAFSKTLSAMQARLAEQRSLSEYATEVDAYVAKGRQALPSVLRRAVLSRNLGRVALALRNDTERPYRDVEVVIAFQEAGVEAFIGMSDLNHSVLPEPPVRFGQYTGWTKGGILMPAWSHAVTIPSLGRHGRVADDGSVTLTPVDVRAHKVAALETFYLQVGPELAGKTITAAWSASGTDADGNSKGTLSIPVSDASLSMTALLDGTLTGIDFGFEQDED